MKKLFAFLLVVCGLASFSFLRDPGNRYYELTKNMEIFSNVYKEINYYYVDDIEPGKLMKIGIDAMLNSLDPYTNYFSEAQVESYRFTQEGKYHGIGAGIKMMDGLPTITELFEESPAYKNGARVGDQIVTVEGKPVAGKSKDEIDAMMQGAAESNLNVTVKRLGESKELPFSIPRGEVDVPNVPFSGMVSDRVGYINLTIFTDQAGAHVMKALNDLKKNNPTMSGLILDLRDNPGGLLREAVNVSNVFIPRNELVVTTKGKVKEWDREFKTLQNPTDDKIPLVVIVDKGSASASEIVSGVLQDLDRAVILGQRSYGKGLVQNTRQIGYNGQVKMTTAKYYIPSGRCIQAVEYEKGEPKAIPDSLRAEFRTKSGRKVLDGGGVKPDVIMESEKMPEIIHQLSSKDVIFKYANYYKNTHKDIKPLKEYKYSEYDDFKKFVSNSKFSYTSIVEDGLSQLKEKAKTSPEWEKIKSQYEALEKSTHADQTALLDKHVDQISKIIEIVVTILNRQIMHQIMWVAA